MYASRNIRLCNKDCVCLFVCPTGATDTEDGQIDRAKCVEGCRACVDACPSHAIHLVMESYPEPAAKADDVSALLLALAERKCREEQVATAIAEASADDAPGAARIARALARSARILAEDCTREAGYMIPQSEPTRKLLDRLAAGEDAGIAELARELRALA